MGVIDNSYCGDGDAWYFPALAVRDTEIHVNDRICQFCLVKNQPAVVFDEVNLLGGKDRGWFWKHRKVLVLYGRAVVAGFTPMRG